MFPSSLIKLQHWFGMALQRPLRAHQNPKTTSEARYYIASRGMLSAEQRLLLYQEQYWLRLLMGLETHFPLLLRLFGHKAFQEELATPYLIAHPPDHWSLFQLGAHLPTWLRETYKAKDRYLVVHSAEMDWAAHHAFSVAALPPLTLSSQLSCERLQLQPYVQLFSFEADLFSFREALLKEPADFYNTHPFPELHRGAYDFVLYRTSKNRVVWEKISSQEARFLARFRKGTTLEEVCEKIATEGNALWQDIEEQLPLWFKQWTVLAWFGHCSFLSS